MRCPFCHSEDSQVKDSRTTDDGSAIRRRRICPNCGSRFTTFERVQLRELTVVKKNHLKVPFDYTGRVDFSNMVLIQNRPYHDEIHRFMDMQLEQMPVGILPYKLYIPVPTGSVYIPLTNYTGSGGKGKHDRSVFAGYSESAFQKLAQKTMRGAR